MIQRKIWITFEKEGIHCYPEAATNKNLEDVKFLANPHRHIFKFRVEVPVMHDNRDIEFIQLKRYCESLYTDRVLDLNYKSCEMIAEDLALKIKNKYNLDFLVVEVSEDGENGATILLS